METGLYVGAIVVLKMNADGSPLASGQNAMTGKLVGFNKSWCEVSTDANVINFRKKHLEIHPDSVLTRHALKAKLLEQNTERKALRLALEAKELDAIPGNFMPERTGCAADGLKNPPLPPIDITPLPVQDLIEHTSRQYTP